MLRGASFFFSQYELYIAIIYRTVAVCWSNTASGKTGDVEPHDLKIIYTNRKSNK